jgi:hypothetical protein
VADVFKTPEGQHNLEGLRGADAGKLVGRGWALGGEASLAMREVPSLMEAALIAQDVRIDPRAVDAAHVDAAHVENLLKMLQRGAGEGAGPTPWLLFSTAAVQVGEEQSAEDKGYSHAELKGTACGSVLLVPTCPGAQSQAAGSVEAKTFLFSR